MLWNPLGKSKEDNMTVHLRTPWMDNQVESLNKYQCSGNFHPFTCYSSHVLRATREGWVCDECVKEGKAYTQNWCHDFMSDWSWKE